MTKTDFSKPPPGLPPAALDRWMKRQQQSKLRATGSLPRADLSPTKAAAPAPLGQTQKTEPLAAWKTAHPGIVNPVDLVSQRTAIVQEISRVSSLPRELYREHLTLISSYLDELYRGTSEQQRPEIAGLVQSLYKQILASESQQVERLEQRFSKLGLSSQKPLQGPAMSAKFLRGELDSTFQGLDSQDPQSKLRGQFALDEWNWVDTCKNALYGMKRAVMSLEPEFCSGIETQAEQVRKVPQVALVMQTLETLQSRGNAGAPPGIIRERLDLHLTKAAEKQPIATVLTGLLRAREVLEQVISMYEAGNSVEFKQAMEQHTAALKASVAGTGRDVSALCDYSIIQDPAAYLMLKRFFDLHRNPEQTLNRPVTL